LEYLIIGFYKAFSLHFDTEICPVLVVVLFPFAFVTVKLTVYFPALLYTCIGLEDIEYDPSPKFQFHVVGDPLLLSVNVTVKGAFPDTLLAINAATGSLGAVTVM